MFRVSDNELKAIESTARNISAYYAKKYPSIGFDEFFSIAQVEIAEAIKHYKEKYPLAKSCRRYIYTGFHRYIRKQEKIKINLPEPDYTSIEYAGEKLGELLSKVKLPPAQREAIEYYLKHKEPPTKERHHFYDAIKTIRKSF